MARDPRHDILFEPIQIGPKVLKNRFYQVPHCNGLGVDKPGQQAYFRGMKAEGGWAAVNTEECSIHPSSDVTPIDEAHIWNEDDVRNLALMCDKVHEHDALAGIELNYMGIMSLNTDSRTPARSASQLAPEWPVLLMSSEMDKEEILEQEGWWVDAAKRARSAGFDIVYVYGGHAFSTPYQFLSPYFNKRTDEYGGSFENRARFWLETVEKVKAAVGDDCAIAVRVCLDMAPVEPLGQTDEDCLRFIEAADALVDVWDVQVGRVPDWGWDAGPSRFLPEDHQRPWVEKVRPYTQKPIIGVGRFTNPDTMVNAIRDGVIDIIGAARPSIADPFLPKKIEEGRLDDIRECIGCNICVAKGTDWPVPGNHIGCTQNATSGEEYRRGWHPEKFERAANADNDVVVVGAGPAGMECAMVLGKRGMRRVHLVEAQDDMGGSMRWIPRLPGLGEWARVVNYRKIQIEKLSNVEFIPNARLDTEQIADYGAEIVIVATGAYWAPDGLNGYTHEAIPGADSSQPWCLTPEQIMVDGKDVPGERVVVIDTEGYFMGSSLAEKLALAGKKVLIMTHLEQVAWYTTYTLEASFVFRRLHKLGIETVTTHIPTRIEDGMVRAEYLYDDDRKEREWQADAVVLVTQRRSNDAQYHELKERFAAQGSTGIELYRTGDCVAPRLVADSIFDGHRLAREIDSPNPAEPLPHIREHRILGATDEDYDNVVANNGSSAFPVSSRTLSRT